MTKEAIFARLQFVDKQLANFRKRLLSATEYYCDALLRGTDKEQDDFARDMKFAQMRFEFYALERAELYAALDEIQ